MPEERLIKKYANRRLYDTTTSSHVKLNDICQLIQDGHDVRVVDDVTGDDLTRAILLQIIAGEEQDGQPMLDEALLMRMIRLYGHPAQQLMSEYLLRSVDAFVQQQSRIQEQMRAAMAATPMAALDELFKTNLDAFERFSKAMRGDGPADDDGGGDNDPSASN